MKAPLPSILLLLAPMVAAAATLEITAADAGTKSPVEDAVAWVVPKGAPPPLRKRDAAVGKKDKTFFPFVSIIQTGTPVHFPNSDPIRHHVYSFSPAKTFEIKLYVGTPVNPVVFDKPGEVVLGCNIHDHMIAYVYVVDTPHFAKANVKGVLRIEGLPAGDYELHFAHPALAAPVPPRAVTLRGDETQTAAVALALKPLPARPRSP